MTIADGQSVSADKKRSGEFGLRIGLRRLMSPLLVGMSCVGVSLIGLLWVWSEVLDNRILTFDEWTVSKPSSIEFHYVAENISHRTGADPIEFTFESRQKPSRNPLEVRRSESLRPTEICRDELKNPNNPIGFDYMACHVVDISVLGRSYTREDDPPECGGPFARFNIPKLPPGERLRIRVEVPTGCEVRYFEKRTETGPAFEMRRSDLRAWLIKEDVALRVVVIGAFVSILIVLALVAYSLIMQPLRLGKKV